MNLRIPRSRNREEFNIKYDGSIFDHCSDFRRKLSCYSIHEKKDYFIFKCLNKFENLIDSQTSNISQIVVTIIENCNFHRNSEIEHSRGKVILYICIFISTLQYTGSYRTCFWKIKIDKKSDKSIGVIR